MSKINGIGIGVSYGNSSGSGSLIDSSTFFAPLKTSLILQRGTGNPTWSRATKAWGFNELGYLEELPNGCAFFGGARLVRNTVRTTSEDFSNVAWIKSNVTITGTNTVVCANATSLQYIYQNTVTLAAGERFGCLVRAKYVPAGVEYIQLVFSSGGFGSTFVNVNLQTGAFNATLCQAIVSAVGDGSYDIFVYATPTSTGPNDNIAIVLVNSISDTRLQSFVGDGVKSFELLRVATGIVTGYDASYVPEYVSVGVVASPYFGAGIDGAKYFDTGWNGSALTPLGFRREAAATNNLLWNRDFRKINWLGSTYGSNLTINSGFDADTDWTKRGTATIAAGVATCAALAFVEQAITTVIGARYALSVTVGTASNRMIFKVGSAGNTNDVFSDPAYRTTTGSQVAYFTATTTTSYIAFGSDTGATGSAVFDTFTCTRCGISVSTVAGLDGISNTATTLTCDDADATILQPITLVSAARCASAYVKRRTGTGTISFTQDGGSTWTDITALINSSTWSRVQITSTLANPSTGLKISTSSDAIDVDCVQNEAGAVATSPIVTTTATVTRNQDSLTYQLLSNLDDTAGTISVITQPLVWTSGGAVGSVSNGLLLSAANSGVVGNDGTNTANGPAGSPTGTEKLALRWGGGAMTAASGGTLGTPGTYDGSMSLVNIGIGVGSYSYCNNVAIFNYAMTDAQLQAITT